MLAAAEIPHLPHLLALAAPAGPGVARANGRFPASGLRRRGPGAPRARSSLRTTFGLVTSYDAGRHWGWTCEKPSAAPWLRPVAGRGLRRAVVATVPMGISIAPAASGGCAWSGSAGAPARGVVDIAVDGSGA